jgi:hypothetical protein
MDAAKRVHPSSQKQNWQEKEKKRKEKLTVAPGAAAVHSFVTTIRSRDRRLTDKGIHNSVDISSVMLLHVTSRQR